jgi:hypothetical protein
MEPDDITVDQQYLHLTVSPGGDLLLRDPLAITGAPGDPKDSNDQEQAYTL